VVNGIQLPSAAEILVEVKVGNGDYVGHSGLSVERRNAIRKGRFRWKFGVPGPWPKQQGITPEALLYGRSYVVINGRTPYLARSWARARASRLIDIG
jgi:hypothetical protein